MRRFAKTILLVLFTRKTVEAKISQQQRGLSLIQSNGDKQMNCVLIHRLLMYQVEYKSVGDIKIILEFSMLTMKLNEKCNNMRMELNVNI